MKKARRLTKREKKALAKLQVQQSKAPRSKPLKIKPMFSLSHYLKTQKEKKHEKMHHRQEKRDAKKGIVHEH